MSVFKRDRDPYRTTTAVQPPARPMTSATPPPPVPAQREAPLPPPPPSAAAEREARPAPSPTLARDSAAVIDKNTQLTGTLHSQGNVLIEGAFQGEVEAKDTVMVEKNAKTEAKVCATDVIISGTFDGEIESKHRLHITASATIKGEIQTPILVIEDGSTVNCRFKMTRAGR